MLSRLSVWWIICHWKNTYKINLHLNAAAISTSTHIAHTYTYINTPTKTQTQRNTVCLYYVGAHVLAVSATIKYTHRCT